MGGNIQTRISRAVQFAILHSSTSPRYDNRLAGCATSSQPQSEVELQACQAVLRGRAGVHQLYRSESAALLRWLEGEIILHDLRLPFSHLLHRSYDFRLQPKIATSFSPFS